MNLEFRGNLWYWRGPAPFFFVTVPTEECEVLRDVSKWVTYGWGMIPVGACIGTTAWKTSLWPKEGGYVVPVKVSVRRAESLEEGDWVTVRLEHAQLLLTSTDRSVTDICFDIGFESLGSFSTLFKTHLGVSPALYRTTSLQAA